MERGSPMGRKNQQNKAERVAARSLEAQLRELDANEVPGDPVRAPSADFGDGDFIQPNAERIAWVKGRHEVVTKLRRREAKRMADRGPDEGGRYGPSPYAARGHIVETAPKDLGKELPRNSQFPLRIATQRIFDVYKAKQFITAREHRAADRLLRIWHQTGRDPKLIANYSPDQVRASADPDARMVGRGDAMAEWDACRALTGVLGFELLVHVVIWDRPAGEWTTRKAMPDRRRMDFAMDMLRQNLDILARHFRY
jgi:hypothetical protein